MFVHDGEGPDVDPATGDEAETEVTMPTQTPGLRRIYVNLDINLLARLDAEAATHPAGREVIIDRALRNYLLMVERDHANPRPEEDT